MSKVYIFFADGFEDIEGLTVVDMMRRAGIDIQTVSIKETKEIKTSHGIHLLTDRTFGECDFSDADMLVIPGGMPGTKYLEEYRPLTDLLTDFSLSLIRQLEGRAKAEEIAESVVYSTEIFY